MQRTHRLISATGAIALLAAAIPAVTGAAGQTFVVDTTADTVDVAPGDGTCADEDGDCSLRAAIQEANASEGHTTINLRNQTYALSLQGDGDAAAGDLDITQPTTIQGRRAIIDLTGLGDRAFDVAAGSSLDVSKISIVGGSPAAGESGGAIRNAGDLTVDDSTLRGNAVVGAGASGGAIFNSGTLRVTASELSTNSATRAGGAIEATSGSSTSIVRSTMSANSTGPMPGNGGGFHLTGEGTVEISNSRVLHNVAANEGGGLWNSALGTMTVDRVLLTGNSARGVEADNGGGGIFNQGNADNTTGGMLTVLRSTIVDNTATEGSGSGGGILNEGGDLTVFLTRINDNDANRAGGAIETVAGNVDLELIWMIGNTAGPNPGNGGGLHVSGAGNVDVLRGYFGNNTAANEGGALWNSAVGTMTVDRGTFRHNDANGTSADSGGGALFNQGDGETGGTLTLTNSSIDRNTANDGAGSGGGILNEQGTLTVTDTDISRNVAARAGGGIETVGGTVDLVGVELDGNRTGSAPGNGGGLHTSGAGDVTIDRSRVTANDAANEGGGLWNSTVGTMTVTDTVIARNKVGVANNGPNLFQQAPVDGGIFTVDGVVIAQGPNNIS